MVLLPRRDRPHDTPELLLAFDFSISGRQVRRGLVRRARDGRQHAPGMDGVRAVDAEHVAFARTAQRHLDLADAVDDVGRHPGERAPAATARLTIASAIRGLVAKRTPCGTWAAARRAGSSAQAFGSQSARSRRNSPCPA